jgi:hypothetical protein
VEGVQSKHSSLDKRQPRESDNEQTLRVIQCSGGVWDSFEGEVKSKYDDNVYELFQDIFNKLPLGYVLNKRVLVVHGVREEYEHFAGTVLKGRSYIIGVEPDRPFQGNPGIRTNG